jgi:hypothetical protein
MKLLAFRTKHRKVSEDKLPAVRALVEETGTTLLKRFAVIATETAGWMAKLRESGDPDEIAAAIGGLIDAHTDLAIFQEELWKLVEAAGGDNKVYIREDLEQSEVNNAGSSNV